MSKLLLFISASPWIAVKLIVRKTEKTRQIDVFWSWVGKKTGLCEGALTNHDCLAQFSVFTAGAFRKGAQPNSEGFSVVVVMAT